MNRKAVIVAIAAVALVIAVALGGLDPDPRSQAAPTTTVVTNIQEDGNFTVLSGAMSSTGLIDVLNGTGPFTVFAPTDAAFKDDQEVSRLMQGNDTKSMEELRQMLLYHVVPAKIVAGNGTENQTLDTASGDRLVYKIDGENVSINNNTVVKSNIIATNGAIYTLDAMLVPQRTSA